MATHVMSNQTQSMTSVNHIDSHSEKEIHHYRRLGLMVLASFVAMYILMYAMVDSIFNVFNNINQLYMVGLMSAPMVIFEILIMKSMKSMYAIKKLNFAILVVSSVVGLICWAGVRNQMAVGDEQFIRSMIPHHASAVLMCNKANVSDSEIKNLCQQILTSQNREIDQMKVILERLKR